jgi:two-component system chemotaxis sensor kinase CheA
MIDIELLEDYTTEAREVLDDLDANLIRLEQEGPTSEILNNIFRAAHSIKGSAEYIGLERSSALTHGVETLLDLMREGMVEITPSVVEFLFKAKDCIASLVDEVARDHEERTDISQILVELGDLVGSSEKSTEVSEITAIIEETVQEEAAPVEEELPEEEIESRQVEEEELDTDFMEPEAFFSESDREELGSALSKIIETEEAAAPPDKKTPPPEERPEDEEPYEEPDESPTGELDAGTTLEETVPHLLNLSLYLDDLADGIAIEEALASFSETVSRLIRSMEFLQIPEATTILESLEASVSSLDLAGNQVSDEEISRLRMQLHDLRPCYPAEIFPWPEQEQAPEDEEPTKDLVKKDFYGQLDNIKTLDPIYYEPLYEAGFTSLDQLRESTFSQLSNIPGMTDQAAEAILATLKPAAIERKSAPAADRGAPKSLLSDVDDDLLNEFEDAFSEAIDTEVIRKPKTGLDPSDELLLDLSSMGEDTDKEIMEIFLSYGWEIVDKIHGVVDKIKKGQAGQQDLLACADLVKSIKASSTYMDFQNLALFLDDWYERSLWAAERADTLSQEELKFIPDSFGRFEKFLHALEAAMKPEAPAPAQPAPVKREAVQAPPRPEAKKTQPQPKPKSPEPEKKPRATEKPAKERPAHQKPSSQSLEVEFEAGKASAAPAEEAGPVGHFEGDVALTRDSAAESPVVRTMRVDSSKVDLLLNQVGELVVNRSYVEQLSNELKLFQREIAAVATVGKDESQAIRDITTKLGEAALSLGRVATDIQEGVMKLRMLPVGQLFNRMPRLIRDLSRRMGKNISLQVMGGDTEVDKRVIEQVYNPLVHLIRNAVDHGIEEKDLRLNRGKKEEGNITLNAYSQGNHVVIDVQDDGGGIDTESVLQRAVENRLVEPGEAKRLSREEAYNFLFVPGFSTSAKVTRTSGRGVGMDVVKKDVEKISGHVEVQSEPNQGTKVSIKIPLTLAIIQALLVRSGKHFFAIPLTSVREIVQIMPHEITTIEGFEVIKFRQETIPILRLGDVFNISVDPKMENEGFLILASAGLKTVGFLVEGLVGEQDVVIKPLAEHVFKSRGLAGSTILGDGTIALVMDVAEIVDDVIASKRRMIALQGNGYHQSYIEGERPEI